MEYFKDEEFVKIGDEELLKNLYKYTYLTNTYQYYWNATHDVKFLNFYRDNLKKMYIFFDKTEIWHDKKFYKIKDNDLANSLLIIDKNGGEKYVNG